MKETSAPQNCDKAALAIFCNNQNVKRVQLRSQAAGNFGTNKFEGAIVLMCAECRKANQGIFKIIR